VKRFVRYQKSVISDQETVGRRGFGRAVLFVEGAYVISFRLIVANESTLPSSITSA